MLLFKIVVSLQCTLNGIKGRGHIYTSDWISFWNFITCAAKNLWQHTMLEVLLPWRYALWEWERCSATVGWILINTIFEMTFRSIIKKITGRRLLVGPFGLPGLCKAVSNPWPNLIYLCFAKMLLRDSAMRSFTSVAAYFRSSGGF